MRIIFIRHGDPDYANDSLTIQGHKEAILLAEYLKDRELGEIHVSSLGRAKATAKHVLDAKGLTEYFVDDWAREFEIPMKVAPGMAGAYSPEEVAPDGSRVYNISWDMYPSFLDEHPQFMSPDWRNTEISRNVVNQYEAVTKAFDTMLESHGYIRNGRYYQTEQGNHDVVTIFCHFGIASVFLSHLLNVSPFLLWHGTCAAPTSITEIVTEERQKGFVQWRMLQMGATPHLDLGGMEPAFAARFCESFEDPTRH